MVDYLSIISKHTQGEHPQTVPALIIHSALVTKKALDIAQSYMERTGEKIDLRLLEEMGMLHDIGIFRTKDDRLFTTGEGHYLMHSVYGEQILLEEGLPVHARAARSHPNISKKDIQRQNLPLPEEDQVPQTPEEKILHLADQFYSKRFDGLFNERSLDEVREYLSQYEGKQERFMQIWNVYCEH